MMANRWDCLPAPPSGINKLKGGEVQNNDCQRKELYNVADVCVLCSLNPSSNSNIYTQKKHAAVRQDKKQQQQKTFFFLRKEKQNILFFQRSVSCFRVCVTVAIRNEQFNSKTFRLNNKTYEHFLRKIYV